MELNYWAQMAQSHWEKHLPKHYKDLEQKGILEEELRKASKQAGEMMGELSEQGMTRTEVMEIVLPQFILLPPENNQEPNPPEK